MKRKTELTFIDLFSGCGGLSLGALKSGFKGILAIERQKNAFDTLKYNLVDDGKRSDLRGRLSIESFNWPVGIEQKNYDINEFLFNHKEYLISIKGKVDMVVGGPPCQGFSNAGKRKEEDPRNQLYKSYLTFVKYVEPKIILIENVAGIASKFSKDGKSYKDEIINKLQKEYYVGGQLISSEIFGVPQKRKRYIIIGFRKSAFNQKVNIQEVFQNIEQNAELFSQKYRIGNKVFDIRKTNVRLALSDLDGKGSGLQINYFDENAKSKAFKTNTYKNAESDYQKMMRFPVVNKKLVDSHRIGEHSAETTFKYKTLLEISSRKNRVSYKFTKEELEEAKWNSKKQMINVLKEDKPAPTLTTCPFDYIHYNTPRILTVREFARIQSFPDWFEFKGIYATSGSMSYTTPRYTQIGNAVPPLMAEGILVILKSYLKPS